MNRSSMPQYNPDPSIPVGFIGSDTQQTSQQMPQQMSQQMPQQRSQPEKRNILFFQPSCQHSQEFLKLLNFSKGLQNKFIQIITKTF